MRRRKKNKMPLKLLQRRAADLLGVVVARGGKVPGWSVRRARHGRSR
ncbi:MAG TPA: hypothetical protein VMN82_04930 [Thermoanaerobaculia bacterium]|nr:hypothetical protein [Thermoanaerobaculia bacterium]